MRFSPSRVHLLRDLGSVVCSVLAVATLTACSLGTADPGTEVVTGIGIVEVHENFDYYNPCANDSMRVGEQRYYPLFDEELAELDREKYLSAETSSPMTGLLRVPAPELGDDIGTLTIYTDGVARFESDNGDEWWFNDVEHTYDWVC